MVCDTDSRQIFGGAGGLKEAGLFPGKHKRHSICVNHVEVDLVPPINFSCYCLINKAIIPEISTNIKVSEDEVQSLPGTNGNKECVRIGSCKFFTS